VGSSSSSDPKGVHDNCDDRVSGHVSVPIPPQNLPFSTLLASNAELLRLHFWDHLVGHRPQFDSVFCCLTCECTLVFVSI